MEERTTKIKPGLIAIAAAYLVPLFWWFMTQPNTDISLTADVFRTLAKVAAIAAMVGFALSPMLALRSRWTDWLFFGLDKSIKIHKKVGVSTAVLAFMHPVFLTFYVLIADIGTFGDVWWPGRLVVAFGLAGFVGMIIATGLTRARKMKHQNWIKVHRTLGFFLLLTIGHLATTRGDAYQSGGLYVYLIGFSSLGLLAFVYQSFITNRFIKHYEYEVVEVQKINETVTDVMMKPLGRGIHHEAGQYAFVQILSDDFDSEPHPFSFATHHNGPYVRFGIKALGDFTSKIQNLKVGTKARIDGPYGGFNYKKIKSATQVWIAGGVGITPFLSMARSIEPNYEGKIVLLYGFNELGDAAFLNELQEIATLSKGIFEIVVVSADTDGYINMEKIAKAAPNYKNADYLLCGPPGMMHAVKSSLKEGGISEAQLHSEEFSF